MTATEYRFGSYRLLPAQRQQLDADAPVKHGGRAFDMLLTLVSGHDRAIPKRELMERVWPHLVVEENNLQVQIVALRKVLGPAAIATIPGRGYRFTLPVAAVHPARRAPEIARDADSAAEPPAGPALPPHAPVLYGRDADIAAVRALLAEHALVSIVGVAGIGKTRLAQAVAHALRAAFADGAWIVDLAALNDPGLVVAEIGRVLGMQLGEMRSAVDAIVRAWRNQKLLVVLDNCEHVLDEVGQLVAALRAGAPEVRILVTSQEPLKDADEHVYRLGALALPGDVDVSSALDAGAIQLFVARAQGLEPHFVLRASNVEAVVDICRRLDGIPLAIELAAARVPLLGVQGVRERLDERFRLLTAGSRLALRRHQTLRAALEWSYGLLSDAEQAIFDRLGVFAGSFSLECAQQLAADRTTDEWAVLDHLGALVDKSLVNIEPGGTPRYRMLETTRAYALERLAARGATSVAMRRHAEVMLELFERSHRQLFAGVPSATLVDELRPDLDNLRSALRWAGQNAGDARIAIALFSAAIVSHGYFHILALRSETTAWSEVLRPLVDDAIAPADAARFWLACAEWNVIAPSAAIEDAKRALALYRNLPDSRLYEFRAWEVLAYALAQAGRLDEAKRALDESFAFRDSAPPWLRAINDNIASIVLGRVGQLSEARSHALACLSVCRQMSKPVDEWNQRAILVEIDVASGNDDEAADAAGDLVAPMLADQTESGRNLRIVASALTNAGRLDAAEPVYREALSRIRRSQDNSGIVLFDAALHVALRGRIDDAARVLAYAERVAEAEGWQPRPVARKLREQLLALATRHYSKDELAQLYDEGRRLTDDEACALAFPLPGAASA
jgi:predicted ATPase/DNA-binding winged helix-turn-helix (wHTH) protein